MTRAQSHGTWSSGLLLGLIAGWAGFALITPQAVVGQEVVDQWRYTLERPAEGWNRTEFDDSEWTLGLGGFGSVGTPGARIGTEWTTNAIWLRKEFPLEKVPAKAALLIHHDEAAEVYLNGEEVAAFQGYAKNYFVVPLSEEKRKALRAGKNLMAVHCRQTSGGQFIDVHLVDADKLPELGPPERGSKPFASELITRWGEGVTPENAWREYPRPQLRRPEWLNLNGLWSYAVTPREQRDRPSEWQGEILVPFSLESRLGGARRLLEPSEALWYRRVFAAPAEKGKRSLLHFEAVDYRCEVFLNGAALGEHVGGHTPFSFDATELLLPGENELLVRVEDATEGWQLRGKQVLAPRGIWYTQVSGIWQTVWLEQVPARYLADLKITTDPAAGSISVRPVVQNSATGEREPSPSLRIVVRDGATEAAAVTGARGEFTLTVPEARLWSPASPHLYTLELELLDEQGGVVDRVESYAGIRAVGKARDAAGHWRFTLNGEPIFHWGTLDQGWWPDGLLTPPSDEALQFEIGWLKSAGFNMIRKHIKVEPRRYYYHCDRLGMLVWQDHVSGGEQPKWTRLQPEPADADWPAPRHRQFMLELERMISTLENHPSIVCWVPFNEAWGQHRTLEVGRWLAQRDPSRHLNIASGGNFWPIGDIVDAHAYPHPSFPFDQGGDGRFDSYIKVVGEFGGHGFPVAGHLWDAGRRNWGYGGLPRDLAEYKARYAASLEMLNALRGKGIAGGVYTQTTDVEGEINGLLTYDRRVMKIPAEELAELHRPLWEPVK